MPPPRAPRTAERRSTSSSGCSSASSSGPAHRLQTTRRPSVQQDQHDARKPSKGARPMSGKKQILLAVAVFLMGSVGVASAEPKVPATVADHLALAKQYREKAQAAKKEAAEHREMADQARRASPNAHKEQGQGDPSVKKMEKHCAAIA